jgi:hypothetical protein
LYSKLLVLENNKDLSSKTTKSISSFAKPERAIATSAALLPHGSGGIFSSYYVSSS